MYGFQNLLYLAVFLSAMFWGANLVCPGPAIADSALAYLDKIEGWEIGVGPSIVIVEKGTARALTSTTAKDDIYAFFFDQEGLGAGLGLQGSKITKIEPDK